MERRLGHARVVTSLPDSAGATLSAEKTRRFRGAIGELQEPDGGQACQAWGTTGQIFRVDEDAGGAGAFGEARGVIAQHLVCANVDEKRWQGLGDQRREGTRVDAGIGVTEIVSAPSGQRLHLKHGAAVVVGANGLAGGGKIGPWRKKRRRQRERNVRVRAARA